MARLISEEIFQDPYFRNLTSIEKLCFIGLFTLAEGTGCLEYDPEGLANRIFSHKDRVGTKRIEEILTRFIRDGKLILYKVERKRCLYVKNFAKYQGQTRCKRPRIPTPPWIDWIAYHDKPNLGKVVIHEDIARANGVSLSNQCQTSAENGAHYAEVEHKSAISMSDLCQTSVEPLTDQNLEAASNQENFFERNKVGTSQHYRIGIDRIGKERIIKGNQNENLSLSGKTKNQNKILSPLSENQFLNTPLEDKTNDKPAPPLRAPPPERDPVEAIPDPETRKRVREGIGEFLKTHLI